MHNAVIQLIFRAGMISWSQILRRSGTPRHADENNNGEYNSPCVFFTNKTELLFWCFVETNTICIQFADTFEVNWRRRSENTVSKTEEKILLENHERWPRSSLAVSRDS